MSIIIATVSGAVAVLSALASVILTVYLWRVNNRPELVAMLEVTSRRVAGGCSGPHCSHQRHPGRAGTLSMAGCLR